ncbi:MAG: hypothetical protein A3F54_00255 [Candidatus Kerfeldbacteria bacterium RIFCSPHIGHO2_12_FULL_48_17]|uniref:SIS domain-containing protein n=1 Tax=Candidatus Kerfeldbacteria bacterium RIFCSPHIGHO2_12_FULL_48_17 TaxID=1798542 RepID=A0A1G2B0G1_9BACT|nr:MAG: hypothetical protein A3F54_00255 [Candidatus Kerfeldbacteria bacterium RIFCSPHIGHO2_12_FULL_48_17]
MAMDSSIRRLAEQFAYKPEVVYKEELHRAQDFFVFGMGGSAMAADLLALWNPTLRIRTRRDYGLPKNVTAAEKRDALFIMSSYSGNTEEVTGRVEDGVEGAFQEALAAGVHMAAIAVGGQLIGLAKQHGIPYVQMPDMGMQPRAATGLSLLGLAALMGLEDAAREASALATSLRPLELEAQGKALAAKLRGHVPIFYASDDNWRIAEVGKIKFNETGKVPAFWNRFPELNHNEMTGFDVADSSRALSVNMHFVFLRSQADHKRVQKRMEVTEKLLVGRGLPVDYVDFPADGGGASGASRMLAMFSVLTILDWAAFYTAENYGVESEEVPMVEELKKLL